MSNDYDEELNEEERIKRNEDIEAIRKLIVGTFETQIGQRCIEHLKKTYIDRDMYVTGATLDMVAFRQGQANIVKQILKELEGSK